MEPEWSLLLTIFFRCAITNRLFLEGSGYLSIWKWSVAIGHSNRHVRIREPPRVLCNCDLVPANRSQCHQGAHFEELKPFAWTTDTSSERGGISLASVSLAPGNMGIDHTDSPLGFDLGTWDMGHGTRGGLGGHGVTTCF